MTDEEIAELKRLAQYDATLRINRKSACSTKSRFSTPEQARKALRRDAPGHVGAYRCEFCGGFHIGSSNKPLYLRRRVKSNDGIR